MRQSAHIGPGVGACDWPQSGSGCRSVVCQLGATLLLLPGSFSRCCWLQTPSCALHRAATAPAAAHTPLQALYQHAKQVFAHGAEGVQEAQLEQLETLLSTCSMHLCTSRCTQLKLMQLMHAGAVPLSDLGVSPTERQRRSFPLNR